MAWIYENDYNNTVRYILGEEGTKYFACIGINPSTAEIGKLDNTLTAVKKKSILLGYDGWIMFNLYPKRCTIFNELEKEPSDILQKNVEKIKFYLKKYCPDIIWCAWGGLITKRQYFKEILKQLSFLDTYDLRKASDSYHPHHPLYLKKEINLISFDFKKYLSNFSCKI